MAHFAEIGLNNTVLRVIVIHNNECLDENGQESEPKGAKFCRDLFGGTWVQTSYNSNFRKNFAGIGYKYDLDLDAFIPPKPFNSWLLNRETCQWEPPIPYPSDNKKYLWNEEDQSWDEYIPQT